jgi:hypothetical protein
MNPKISFISKSYLSGTPSLMAHIIGRCIKGRERDVFGTVHRSLMLRIWTGINLQDPNKFVYYKDFILHVHNANLFFRQLCVFLLLVAGRLTPGWGKLDKKFHFCNHPGGMYQE